MKNAAGSRMNQAAQLQALPIYGVQVIFTTSLDTVTSPLAFPVIWIRTFNFSLERDPWLIRFRVEVSRRSSVRSSNSFPLFQAESPRSCR